MKWKASEGGEVFKKNNQKTPQQQQNPPKKLLLKCLVFCVVISNKFYNCILNNNFLTLIFSSWLILTETKHGGSKNGKKEGLSGSSFFTWFMVIALLGVWTSVAVVWFELVDYEEVLGKNFKS